MAFKEALALLLVWEGVYDDDVDDPGGETVFGITRKFEPTWDGWPVVDRLKEQSIPVKLWGQYPNLAAKVSAHYQGVCDKMDLGDCHSDKLMACILGGYVNQGPRVEKWTQEAIAELGYSILVDGDLGPTSMAFLNQVLKLPYGETILLNGLMIRRARAYSKAKPKFIAGLFDRLFAGA